VERVDVTVTANLPFILITVGASLAGLSNPRFIDALEWETSR